jgi:sec-independent protein translocase protein TatA
MSIGHWIVVLLIVLVLFGAGRLSDIGKGLGEGIKNFKKGLKDEDADEGVRVAEKRKAALAAEDEPKKLADASADKKKVIQIEIGEDDDEEEILRKLAAKKAAAKAARSD